MAKIFPTLQRMINMGSQDRNFVLTKIQIKSTTSDYFVLPDSAVDVKELKSSRTGAGATFYLSGTLGTVVNVDGGTIGQNLFFVSRHDKDLSYDTEGS